MPKHPSRLGNDDDISGLLQAGSAGEAGARDEVVERMYAQLERLAIGALRAQAGQATFEPTVLLNDALLKLVDGGAPRAAAATTSSASWRALCAKCWSTACSRHWPNSIRSQRGGCS